MKLWKLQKFLGDVVYDLRNRGLLPVVALLLLAMVAIPVVISRGGSSPPPASAVEQAVKAAPEGSSAVLAYSPGVRDYRKRLDQLQAKDPFRRQFSQAAEAATALSGTVTGVATGADATTTASAPQSGTVTGTGGSTSKKQKTTTRYFYYQTDALVGEASEQLTPHNRLASMAPLPSQATPVLIYLGPSTDGRYALFLVSNQVSSVTGSGVCIPKPDDCALLALGRGQTGVVVNDADGKTYLVQVVRIKRVVTSKLPRG
jgi:hypothetical protein